MSSPFHAVAADWLHQSVVEIRLDESTGSGFTWGFDVVVTNAHVARASRLRVRLPDGQMRSARLRLADSDRDLAVLDVPGLGLPAVVRRDPLLLRPGESVFAIGCPFGVRFAFCSGIVHAVGRLPPGYPVPERVRRRTWVQADLRLAPGNSGGPLADADGRVVGMNTMIAGGLALAIPVTEVDVVLRRRAA
ncbi:MAG: S1C family serine protease [Gemmatimonadales bacterium]